VKDLCEEAFMIDTHLHILPGIDDGPETLQEALALAEVLVQEGIHTAFATPHYNDEFVHSSVTEVQGRVNELQRELEQHNIPLRIFAGHEALIQPGLVEDIQSGRLATLNGSRYLLLELWNSAWLPETERVIFQLRVHGFVPLLAHVERYRAFQKDPERLVALERQGMLAQLTASSLIGMQGNTARRCAETLLKKGLIHCIASDAHGLYKRPPSVAHGLQRATEIVGQEQVYKMVEEWPATIVNNEEYSVMPSNSSSLGRVKQ
jgi:protein-tyrosine phosphatase